MHTGKPHVSTGGKFAIPMRRRGAAVVAAMLIAACCTSGCSQFDLRRPIPWAKGEDGNLEPAMKLVCVWSDTVMNQAGAAPVRGFGGRLMFYGAGDKPVKVKGSVVVYAFVEDDRIPTDVAPDRKYVFTPEQFESHYSESKIGHSYSVWIPWSEVGGEPQKITLLVRFNPTEAGGVVVGEQSTQMLPGIPRRRGLTDIATETSSDSAPPRPQLPIGTPTYPAGPDKPVVQQVAYEQPVEPRAAAMEDVRMTTSTIALPSRFQAHQRSGSMADAAIPTPVAVPGAAPTGTLPIANGEVAYGAPTYATSVAAPTIRSWPGHPAISAAADAPTTAIPTPAATPPGRYEPHRLRALGAPLAPLARDHDRLAPSR